MITTDQRHGRRFPISRPAKLRCLQTGKYMAGRTRNISTTGAMLEVDRPTLLVSGQRLAVGVAWTRKDNLLHTEHLIHATVVRSLALDKIQHVAVQFDQPLSLAQAYWIRHPGPPPRARQTRGPPPSRADCDNICHAFRSGFIAGRRKTSLDSDREYG